MMTQEIAIVTSGKFKGRKIILTGDKEATIAVVERINNNYGKACLIHEVFIKDQGCEKCKESERKYQRGSRRQITEI